MTTPTQPSAPRPLCFVAMPFGERATGQHGPGAPKSVDFNALWEKAYKPAIEMLGYVPMRGDDGPLTGHVMHDILEILARADVVVADISVVNANVYYELGIRHAVVGGRPTVALAATWARVPFALRGVRALYYPFTASNPDDEDYAALFKHLISRLPAFLVDCSPIHVAPNAPRSERGKAASFERQLRDMHELQSQMRAVRLADPSDRPTAARQLLDQYASGTNALPRSTMELVMFACDLPSNELLATLERLPPEIRRLPEFAEQEQRVIAQRDDVVRSIAGLEHLVALHGPTRERERLLGERWKQLFENARTPDERAGALDRTIEHYARGMELDLNEFDCSCNLPRALRQRGADGDEARANAIVPLVLQATARALKLDASDRRAALTRLGATFDAGDAREAWRTFDLLRGMTAANWGAEIRLDDFEISLSQQSPAARAELKSLADALRRLATPAP